MKKKNIALCAAILITSTLLCMDPHITPHTEEKRKKLIEKLGDFGDQIKEADIKIEQAQNAITLLTEFDCDTTTPHIPQIPQLPTGMVSVQYNTDEQHHNPITVTPFIYPPINTEQIEPYTTALKTPLTSIINETSEMPRQPISLTNPIGEALSQQKTPPPSPRSEIPKPITPIIPTKNPHITTSNDPSKKTWFKKNQPMVIIAGIGMSIAAFIALFYYLKNSTNSIRLS